MPRFATLLLLSLMGFSAAGARRSPPPTPIAVVKAVETCAVAERAYAQSRAKSVADALAGGGVKADLISDQGLDAALAGRRLVYLVTWQTPSPIHLAALNRFCTRGGRVAVVQSYSPALAGWMGVPPVKGADMGPLKFGNTPKGWWFPNWFAAAVPETAKARLLLSVAGAVVPGSWNAATWDARQKAQRTVELDYGRRQVRRPGEIHAVWDHSGQGLYPGDWPRTLRLLRDRHVTDLFVNVAGAGFAHYPSKVLPQSDVVRTRGDQLAACLAAAKGTGIRVHAWMLCFTSARASAGTKRSFEKKGWRLRDVQGKLTDYLDPANADVRWYLLRAIDEVARTYPVAGVQLDFVRWYEGARKPRNAAGVIRGFVESARGRMRAARPQAWLTAAVLSTHPSCVQSVGQDWPAWIDAGLVDYAVPMNYLQDPKKYADCVARQGSVPARARHLISGLGVTANESRLTAIQVIDQVNVARRFGFAGVALFDLNPTLAETILPVLALGQF